MSEQERTPESEALKALEDVKPEEGVMMLPQGQPRSLGPEAMNPFWSQAARDEAALRAMRPASLPVEDGGVASLKPLLSPQRDEAEMVKALVRSLVEENARLAEAVRLGSSGGYGAMRASREAPSSSGEPGGIVDALKGILGIGSTPPTRNGMGQGSLLGPLGQDLGGVPAWADYQEVSREAAKANLMEAFQGASREVGAAQGGLGSGPGPTQTTEETEGAGAAERAEAQRAAPGGPVSYQGWGSAGGHDPGGGSWGNGWGGPGGYPGWPAGGPGGPGGPPGGPQGPGLAGQEAPPWIHGLLANQESVRTVGGRAVGRGGLAHGHRAIDEGYLTFQFRMVG